MGSAQSRRITPGANPTKRKNATKKNATKKNATKKNATKKARPRNPATQGTPVAPAKIIQGDCLDHLSRLAKPAARFDLVYVDPPFNTGFAHSARKKRGARAQGETAYDDSWGGLNNFLDMLRPRVTAMRTVMSDVGSLWLHLDHRAIHDTKIILDDVFGAAHFRGEIIWVPGNGSRRRSGPGVTHQTILIYSKTLEMIWNGDDPALREPFAATSLRTHFRKKDEDGRQYRDRTINGKTYRYYADEGRRLGSVWSDCPAMNANTPLSDETTGYPTQKPEALLERIILASSLVGSRVLDPMCGSGTTIAVAARLGRPAVGMDRSATACRIARKRIR